MTGPSAEHRRVLVVDDQPTLIRAIRRMLAHHDVTTVGSAREALARIEAGERFDVILSDLMMPGMNGMELHAELARVAPDLADRMVFMTGGAFTQEARAFCDQAASRTIEKPFDRAELVALVEAMLR